MADTSNPTALTGLHDKNVDEQAAAEYLGLSVATLRRWRVLGRGPRYRKLGSLVRYSVTDLERWVSERPSGGESPRDSSSTTTLPQKQGATPSSIEGSHDVGRA
jgi:predicted DNA-binding transcriptional regulator AlpA